MMENKDNIEQFFEKHLKEKEFPYQEEDWKKLENELDKALPVVPAPWWKRMIPYLTLIILAFLTGWFSHLWIIDPTENQLTQREMINDPKINKSFSEIDVESIPSTRPQEQKQSSTGADYGKSEASVLDPGYSPEHKSSQGDQPAREFRGKRSNPIWSVQSGRALNSEEGKSTGGEILSGDIGINPFLGDVLPLRPPVIFPLYLTTIEPRKVMVSVYRDTAIQVKEKKGISKNEKDPSANLWAIGVSTAPELNSVGLGKDQALSWEAGVNVFYSLTSHWRISTGLLYARKTYSSSGAEYHPPAGYWNYYTNGKIPQSIDANCSVADVPVNVTYLWNPDSRFTFTTTAGISSYFIFDENYSYSYHYSNPGAYDNWKVTDNSRALLGMVNLAVGMEYQLTPRMHLMLEPYFKVPLKEIGFGKVNLYGSGAFFTLRYSFYSNQKTKSL